MGPDQTASRFTSLLSDVDLRLARVVFERQIAANATSTDTDSNDYSHSKRGGAVSEAIVHPNVARSAHSAANQTRVEALTKARVVVTAFGIKVIALEQWRRRPTWTVNGER